MKLVVVPTDASVDMRSVVPVEVPNGAVLVSAVDVGVGVSITEEGVPSAVNRGDTADVGVLSAKDDVGVVGLPVNNTKEEVPSAVDREDVVTVGMLSTEDDVGVVGVGVTSADDGEGVAEVVEEVGLLPDTD